MLNIVTWAIIIVGAILMLASLFTFKRKGEAELSSNVIETPLFKVGSIVAIIGVVAKIVFILFIG